MSGLLVGLVLALGASVFLNGSYLLQHGGAAKAPEVTPRHPFASLRGLLTSRLWLAGAAVGTAGWAMHITALTKAPLSLVQAFLAGGLALVVPLAARAMHQPMKKIELVAVGLMTLALVGLTVGLNRVGDHHHFTTAPLAAYLGVLALVSAGLAFVGGDRRAHALGLAGGILYGGADVAIKGLTGIGEDEGFTHVLTSPWLLVAIATSLGAFFFFQRGLQTGRALPLIALMTAGTNVISIAGGFFVFGDPVGATTALSILHSACFVLVGVAAWMLAPAQAAFTAPQPGGDSKPGAAPSPRPTPAPSS